ncbi:protoporphyrinogen/coproporphyrinogen oxidase [Steroidobacter cummioxidans]|uniref:protoporphyrinogen/coproporphyrinogen oxidase n=1 Tax=Steroidobacter cummioxidans TaxID=1803913 RepID=UPI000E30F1F5|nr:NAD(P)-binding protein [Steroidobacter cummioxidans]
MEEVPFVVLGAGMAGLGASYALDSAGVSFSCYDKNNYVGGHSRTLRYDNGFIFDEGGHISFTKNPHVQQVLAENVRGAFVENRLTIDNYWQGLRLPHPIQNNLRHLPPELIVQIISDYKTLDACGTASGNGAPAHQTYADWLHLAYGPTFAKTFPMAYGKKYHTTDMDNLTTDWIGPRMYRPTIQELVRSALPGTAPIPNYIDHFRYPSTGGFLSYLEPFESQFRIQLNKRLTQLDPVAKAIEFADGETISYGSVISSIPLPELISLMKGVPGDVLAASQRLAFSTVWLVNLGVGRADFSDAMVTYFYDEDVIFSRINLPHLFSSKNAPVGCGTIQAEIYFSEKYKPFASSPQNLIERTIEDLRRCGFLRADDRILLADAAMSRYANVIYDFDRMAALRVVHGYLRDAEVRCCGRFGNWDHAWTDQAFVSGEEAARAALGD